uniref:EF-hand domain-containing protein n=1 Tax=Crocodylus porosus TaxID=8502 RepID=A0A7M4DZE4_CROPO
VTSGKQKTRCMEKWPLHAKSIVFVVHSHIQEFKGSFSVKDQNGNCFIDKENLQDMPASLGKICFSQPINSSLMNEAQGLRKITVSNPQNTLRSTLYWFDTEGKGCSQENCLLLMTMGVWFADEVNEFYGKATGDIKGSFNDFKLSCLLKHSVKDKDGRTEILLSADISKFHMCLFFDSFSLG